MKRFQTIGFFFTLASVAVLLVSLVAGLGRTAEPETADYVLDLPEERIRVEVLNSAGVSGLARSATQRLRERGFDVVYFGNAPGERRDSSQVIDRVGRQRLAAKVAEALEISSVRAAPDSSLYVEATVILGKDWNLAP